MTKSNVLLGGVVGSEQTRRGEKSGAIVLPEHRRLSIFNANYSAHLCAPRASPHQEHATFEYTFTNLSKLSEDDGSFHFNSDNLTSLFYADGYWMLCWLRRRGQAVSVHLSPAWKTMGITTSQPACPHIVWNVWIKSHRSQRWVLQFTASNQFSLQKKGFGWPLGWFVLVDPAQLEHMQQLVPAASAALAGGQSDWAAVGAVTDDFVAQHVVSALGAHAASDDKDVVSMAPFVSEETVPLLHGSTRLPWDLLLISDFVHNNSLKVKIQICNKI